MFLRFVPSQPGSLAVYTSVQILCELSVGYWVKHQPSLLLPQLTSLQGYEVYASIAKAKTQVPGWSAARH